MRDLRYAYNAYSELLMLYCASAAFLLALVIEAVHLFITGGSLSDPALLIAIRPLMLAVIMLIVGWIVGLIWNLAGEGWRNDDLGQTLGNILGQASFAFMLPAALTASLANTAHLMA